MTVLVAAMAADYFSGLAVAGMGKSTKKENGGLSSKVGWQGLLRRGMMMLVVLVENDVNENRYERKAHSYTVLEIREKFWIKKLHFGEAI